MIAEVFVCFQKLMRIMDSKKKQTCFKIKPKGGQILLCLLVVCLATSCTLDAQSSEGGQSDSSAQRAAKWTTYGSDRVPKPPEEGRVSFQQQQGTMQDLRPQMLGDPRELSQPAAAGQSQAVSLYKQPNSWLLGLLKELFDDIDWQAIADARDQIEKFIRRVDSLVGSFRAVVSRFNFGGGSPPSSGAQSTSRGSLDEGRASSRRWWWDLGNRQSGGTNKAASDTSSVREMLERIACFVGYVRLMNFSNEALAELDASKVVTNLFGAGSKRNTTSWWASNWFG